MIRKIKTDPTRPAVLKKIAELEKEGCFSAHPDPIDPDAVLPVTPNFPYLHTTCREKALAFFRRHLEVYPFTRRINQKELDTKVQGKENLRGIGAAVITCNHITKFDCLAVQQALRPNRPFVVAAPFNNMRGHFGDLMRAGGMLPMGEDIATQRAFLTAVRHYLAKGKRILIYPEGSMWWNYEKPRPMLDGAFDIAVRNRVPIIPMFITFRSSGVFDDNGIEHRYLTLHIMPPIYPADGMGFRDNVRYMKTTNERLCREKYKEVYGDYPIYTTEGGFPCSDTI